MSTIASDMLETELAQPLTMLRDLSLAGLRVHINIYNLPAGIFYFNIYNSNSELVKSFSFTALGLKTYFGFTSNYFAAHVSFSGAFNLRVGDDYTIKLESSGYTYSYTSWVGWNKDYNYAPVNMVGVAEDWSDYPYEYKLLEYNNRELFR
jgi:hypothetical protein